MVVIVMGVAGSGKSTIGPALAGKRGAHFIDGDGLHPRANIEKMRRGQALTDTDRKPWLDALSDRIDEGLARDEELVVACSALKQSYRERLCRDPQRVRFVYLRASREVFEARLRARRDHFMCVEMLESQLATLEEPTDAVVVDAQRSPDEIVAAIQSALYTGDAV